MSASGCVTENLSAIEFARLEGPNPDLSECVLQTFCQAIRTNLL